MTLRFLLDTHIVVWWLSAPKKLSREQHRAIRESERRGDQLALSASSLIEIATLRIRGDVKYIFSELESNPIFRILPITIPIAVDAGALNALRDPADRTIVATARVHGLRLLTSDERIVQSKLVSFIS